ncbi:membrane protein [Streptomyces sp. NBRC 14336]|uniref:MFS transporter n=1 Tax=Streptomyces sp. NBRC 14336 TaxID=3030992 RepID=UPI0024A1551A|nr:MFS transporter [Streptomyces sp. NBRC 14336]WBO81273.1 MFS transporter [Streptomyces sp. SBE_14.2]GLW49635.1 membrane protein [Streptomyces sp. NBRC 14336]
MKKSADRERLPRSALALLAAVFVDALGSGLYMAVSVVFLTRYLDLGSSEVGLGLGVAGAVSFALLVPTGILADRAGPRRMLIAAHVTRAALLACFPFASGFVPFLCVVSLLAVADRAASPLVQGLFGAAVDAGQRVRAMGMARSLQNLGLSLGGLAAAGALLWDSDGVYLAVVYGNSLSFVLAAVLVTRLRAGDSGGGRPLPWRRRLAVFRDRRFTWLTVLNSVVSLHVTVLTVGIPLWVLAHDDLPRSVIAWTLVLNTVVVVVFQVHATRDVESAADGGRALRLSGLLLAACCCLLAVTGELPAAWAVAVILAAVGLQAFAEMHQQAGAWAISYDLAPEDRRQVYLAFFSLGNAARNTYGPLVVTFLVVQRGAVGWLLLGALALGCGAWAARSGRPSAVSGAPSAPAVSLTDVQGETHGTHP